MSRPSVRLSILLHLSRCAVSRHPCCSRASLLSQPSAFSARRAHTSCRACLLLLVLLSFSCASRASHIAIMGVPTLSFCSVCRLRAPQLRPCLLLCFNPNHGWSALPPAVAPVFLLRHPGHVQKRVSPIQSKLSKASCEGYLSSVQQRTGAVEKQGVRAGSERMGSSQA